MSHFLSKSGFECEPSPLESEDANMFFLIQDLPIKNIPSLVDTDLDAWPPIYGEPTGAYTRCNSTAPVLTSSTIPILDHKRWEYICITL